MRERERKKKQKKNEEQNVRSGKRCVTRDVTNHQFALMLWRSKNLKEEKTKNNMHLDHD